MKSLQDVLVACLERPFRFTEAVYPYRTKQTQDVRVTCIENRPSSLKQPTNTTGNTQSRRPRSTMLHSRQFVTKRMATWQKHTHP